MIFFQSAIINYDIDTSLLGQPSLFSEGLSIIQGFGSDIFPTDSDPAQLKKSVPSAPNPTFIRFFLYIF